MKECKLCGKKGIFLKLSSSGLCKDCEKNEYERATKYYTDIISLFNEINIPIKLSDYQELLAAYTKKIDLCNQLQKMFLDSTSYLLFESVFKSHLIYKSEMDKRIGYAYSEDFRHGFMSATHSDFSQYINDLRQMLFGYVRNYQAKIHEIQSNERFRQQIKSIPKYSISITDVKLPKLPIADLEKLKFTGITPRSNYERLGNFVVIDVETTGLSPVKNEIIEVAAIKFQSWIPEDSFSTLIKPLKKFPDEIADINHITYDMLSNSPFFYQIISSLNDFIGSSNLIGHNLMFDLKFLYKNGYDFLSTKRKYYDTLEISQKLLKGPSKKWDREYECYEIDDSKEYDVEDHKLYTLCEYYKICDDSFAHRALSDCLATGLLFQKLVKQKVSDC